MMRRLAAILCVVLATAWGALAQDTANDGPDYEAWARLADRAEGVIDAARASDPAFETLRGQLVVWRTAFHEASGLNASRIESMDAQIEALGPPPEDGQEEPEEIATQRAELSARLVELAAPGRRAAAELRRAEGLIDEIDALLAQRQAGALLSLQPSPLNPVNWPGALEASIDYLGALWAENLRLWQSPIYRAEFGENAPLVLFYLLFAGVLFLRGWRWVGQMMAPAITRETQSPKARLALFAMSLLQHAVIVFAVVVLVQAVQVSGFVGLRGSIILGALPQVALTVMAALWVGRQVFPLRESAAHPLDLSEPQMRQGRRTASGLGFLMGLGTLLASVMESEGFDTADRLVLFFPFVVLTGLLLARIGRLLLIHCRNRRAAEDATPVRTSVFVAIGRAVILLGFAGPVLAGVGYFTAGASFLFPAVLSLGLLASIGILQRLATNLYGALTGRREGLDEALTPTLIGFLLMLASAPLFALIWGIRQAQLVDLWAQAVEGFTIGGIQISPRNFLIFVLVFVAGYTATRLVQNTLRQSVLPKTRLDAGGRNAVTTGTGYLGIFISALIAISVAGIDLSSIAIVAGALSVGIGFGLQAVVSNFVSGIILLVERPIKEGDWIQIGSTAGYVREISVRSTRIETFDRSDVIVPNADLISGVVTNMTHHDNAGRVIVPVGVAYGTDTRRIEEILQEIAEAHPMVLLNPKPTIIFQGFGADSLDFEIRAILRDVNWMLNVKSDLNHEIARRFGDEGIEIPFMQRDIWIRNPEALPGGHAEDNQDTDLPPQEGSPAT